MKQLCDAINPPRDRGCIQLGAFGSGQTTTTPPPGQLNTDTNGTGQAPESAFEFQPTRISTMVGGHVADSNWRYAEGKYIAGFYALNKAELFCPREGQTDPVADEWERRALCFMGIDADTRADPKLDCKPDDLLKFNGSFASGIMIGKCDAVHSGVFLSFVAVLIVGLTIASTLGLMGYFQVPNGNLNNNLYFLLLGLGVDDAFVLTSEFLGHTRANKDLPVEERIAQTARTGGISVLITSATDALAFLVGATTVLPALGWFCTYAGVSIMLCFTYQLTVFLPCLALNAYRHAPSFRVAERPLDEPKGCCCFCLPSKAYKGGVLKRGLKRFAEIITTPVGQIVTFAVFLGVAIAGVYGSTLIYKDFKLEWFIPDSSYVNNFFNINSEYFSTGTAITVNFPGALDAFDQQQNLHDVYSYLNSSDLINKDVVVDSWYREFMEWATEPNQVETLSATFSPSRSDASAVFANRAEFYPALHVWYRTAVGSRYRNSMKWADEDCMVNATVDSLPSGCTVTDGLSATRFNAELSLASTNTGTDRYNTMTTMRKEIDSRYSGAFPYSFDFLYWEEELVRNLIICGGVILVAAELRSGESQRLLAGDFTDSRLVQRCLPGKACRPPGMVVFLVAEHAMDLEEKMFCQQSPAVFKVMRCGRLRTCFAWLILLPSAASSDREEPRNSRMLNAKFRL
ncbi:Patched domain-containing protein 3 [Symbiodinium microadriaticum]|uniref:Patched domain-containing protein 3 n=1 Tax=Symbiodinium microadriaticum TaxID=2951 RepID=A0A1Q9DLQ8_SYMMI|nr:Patched domain-containing protein 3 [Symbiodinium microadriaticum]